MTTTTQKNSLPIDQRLVVDLTREGVSFEDWLEANGCRVVIGNGRAQGSYYAELIGPFYESYGCDQWESSMSFVGGGDTPESAILNLKRRMSDSEYCTVEYGPLSFFTSKSFGRLPRFI